MESNSLIAWRWGTVLDPEKYRKHYTECDYFSDDFHNMNLFINTELK